MGADKHKPDAPKTQAGATPGPPATEESVVSCTAIAAQRGEEHQVGHQGHSQQHDLELQTHPQEDGAGDEGQDAATGVILGEAPLRSPRSEVRAPHIRCA